MLKPQTIPLCYSNFPGSMILPFTMMMAFFFFIGQKMMLDFVNTVLPCFKFFDVLLVLAVLAVSKNAKLLLL